MPKISDILHQGQIIVFKDRIVRLWNPQHKQDSGETEFLFEDTCKQCGAKSPQYAYQCFGCGMVRPNRFGLTNYQIGLIHDTEESIRRHIPYKQILEERIKYAKGSINLTNQIIKETQDELAKLTKIPS